MIVIREKYTGRRWKCPGVTMEDALATAALWRSWGIACAVETADP